MQEAVFFIPRILPNVSKKNIIDRFAELQIGSVTNIQSAKRVNENKNRYWFAFITVKLWETPEGCRFWNKAVVCKETIRVDYFSPIRVANTKALYWEIQLCNKNNQRLRDIKWINTFETREPIQSKKKEQEPKKMPISKCKLELEEGEIYESSFTLEDQLEIYRDYLELEKCIFGSNYLRELY